MRDFDFVLSLARGFIKPAPSARKITESPSERVPSTPAALRRAPAASPPSPVRKARELNEA